MHAISRQDVVDMLIWALFDQKVESASTPHPHALTIYCNVLALPIAEAATLISFARSNGERPTDPVQLARWMRGLCLLQEMLTQPMSGLPLGVPVPPMATRAA